LGGIKDGLLYGELAAGAPNHILGRTGFHELKAIAEGTSLAHECVDVNIAGRQRKLQANDLSNRNFHTEHSGNPRLADIHCVSAYDRGVARIDTDISLQSVARMSASFHEAPIRIGIGFLPKVHATPFFAQQPAGPPR